ncbi:MAG TPA: DNA-binding protein YbiB, partial [Quisquiliibacterium sp.]|nr:DNA-binding protein YbiB [Quisquiliibacterium sp.]
LAPGRVTCVATRTLLPALGDLLDVRRVVGLRNPAHSLVKLLNPCAGRALVVGCHTHPEYAVSMAGIFARIGADAMLLRGTEGEPVADARRMPALDAFIAGARIALESAQRGTLHTLPDLPAADPDATAHYVRAVLAGDAPMPEPIAAQVDHLVALHRQVVASAATGAVCA